MYLLCGIGNWRKFLAKIFAQFSPEIFANYQFRTEGGPDFRFVSMSCSVNARPPYFEQLADPFYSSLESKLWIGFLFYAFWARNKGPKNAIFGRMMDFTKSGYFMEKFSGNETE